MVRTGCSLGHACTELGFDVTNEELIQTQKRASFLTLLWQERHRYFSDLAKDPNFTQDTVVGKLISLAQKLEEEGAHDKAGEVLFKIAKIRGYVGPESQVSVFGELSQRDLDAIRKQVEEGKVGGKSK